MLHVAWVAIVYLEVFGTRTSDHGRSGLVAGITT